MRYTLLIATLGLLLSCGRDNPRLLFFEPFEDGRGLGEPIRAETGVQGLELVCNNACPDAFDDFCDDGGIQGGEDFCLFGSDCGDCGPRVRVVPPLDHAGRRLGTTSGQPTPLGGVSGGASGGLCTNTCETAFDEECDDGGLNAEFDFCQLGTDCADCGRRGGDASAPEPDRLLCTAACDRIGACGLFGFEFSLQQCVSACASAGWPVTCVMATACPRILPRCFNF